MPPSGPGSMASLSRRAGAAFADWILCQLIAVGLFHVNLEGGGAEAFVPLAIFAMENVLLVSTTGTTIGHRLFGMQVRQVRRGVFPVQVLVRTALLCLFLPAILSDRDGRGLHDKAAGTVICRA
jgi:uncharacterized RDD family membrane protein YckC